MTFASFFKKKSLYEIDRVKFRLVHRPGEKKGTVERNEREPEGEKARERLVPARDS